MKGILEFNLPEETKEHLAAVQGSHLAYILYEISYTVRRKYLKYGTLTAEQDAIAEKIFEDIQEEIDINLENLL